MNGRVTTPGSNLSISWKEKTPSISETLPDDDLPIYRCPCGTSKGGKLDHEKLRIGILEAVCECGRRKEFHVPPEVLEEVQEMELNR